MFPFLSSKRILDNRLNVYLIYVPVLKKRPTHIPALEASKTKTTAWYLNTSAYDGSI